MAKDILHADVVLKGGLVIDGRGQPAFAADVAVRDDTIIAIGDLTKVSAIRVIDVSSLVVAPGFIDVHTHDDLICITQPEMTPKISQGVTTLIVGNCGISAAPLRFDDSVSEPFNLLGQKDDFAYDTFASYRQAAAVEELQRWAQTVAKAGGVYTAHIRDERDGIVGALQEAFAVCKPDRTP